MEQRESYNNNNIPNVDPKKRFSYFSKVYKKISSINDNELQPIDEEEINFESNLNRHFTMKELKLE